MNVAADQDSPETNTSIRISPSRLVGSVRVSGAKNSALHLLVLSVLSSGTLRLWNFPAQLLDAQVQVDMLRVLGKICTVEDGIVTVREESPLSTVLDWNDRSIRNTPLVLGALLGRFREGRVPLPGGCNLGDRKIDLHEMVLRCLGASVWIEDGYLCAEAPRGLIGCDLHLPIRSTGATENALICASLAHGRTRIWNPHVRPEVIDIVRCLRGMGAKIQVFGQEHIQVDGVLGLEGTGHGVIPDNMEAITWMVAAAITGGEVEILDFPCDHLEVPLIHLRESGVRFRVGDRSLLVEPGRCYPIDISTGPYPGINSDMQPLFASFAAVAIGKSRLIDLRFPGRYQYADQFTKLGVQHQIVGDLLIIDGGAPLNGATVSALDLRAGAALALLGLRATGRTTITDAWQIERGYERFVEKLVNLGADVERVEA